MFAKKKKTPAQKNLSATTDLLPILDYRPDGAIVTKTGLLDIFKITSKDLNSAKDYDIEFDIIGFANLFKSFGGDLKIVSFNFPVDTFTQVDYVTGLLSSTDNPIYQADLAIEKEVLQKARTQLFEREFYLFLFAKDDKQYKRFVETISTYLTRYRLTSELTFEKKTQILHKMCNMNSDLATLRPTYIPHGIPKGKKYNHALLQYIQPQFNLSFGDQRVIKKGDGYEACIHVSDYPDHVAFNWLSDLTLFDNSIVTIDIANTDRYQTIRNINKSLEEQAGRYADARYTTERMDAQKVYNQLSNVYESMTSMGEVMKSVTIRIFLFHKTLHGIEEDISSTLSHLQSLGFKAGVYLDESQWQWRSLFLSATEQSKLIHARKGKSISSEALATGHPYHFSSLDDPLGFYMGYTKTHGAVKLDRFHKDKQRLSYCGVIMGTMGSGKSTTMKRCIKLDAISGNFVRGYATNSEFDNLINNYGGKMIKLDGTDGFLNALQVYKTHETDSSSFLKHIAKVSTFYRFLSPNCDEYDLAELEILLRELYRVHMGFDEDSSEPITGRPATDYPIWSDLLTIIQQDIYSDIDKRLRREDISPEHFSRVERIELIIKNLIQNYGQVFNGHSSISDFSHEQLVFFDVANLKQFGDTIFDAQLFSSLSLLWDGLITIGGASKDRFDKGEISIEQATKYMIYMDEAHQFINAKKTHAVDFLNDYVREGRKYFGGILFATQRVTDLFPESADSAGVSAIRSLLSLSQYKFIFRQGTESREVLETAFRGELTETDLDEIPLFEQGECLLVISGMSTIRFKVEVSKQELQLYSGGA